MGGDGGTKAIQRKFMRGSKTPNELALNEKQNVKEIQKMKSQLCSISNKPLMEPIVACELGNLFNKEEILMNLINKTLNITFKHIRGLKDLKTLKFHRRNGGPTSSSSSSFASSTLGMNEESVPFICPVTGDVFNGNLPFVFIWSTGYVLSERAIREIGIESLQGEYGPFHAIDIIKINPMNDAEINILNSNMEAT